MRKIYKRNAEKKAEINSHPMWVAAFRLKLVERMWFKKANSADI